MWIHTLLAAELSPIELFRNGNQPFTQIENADEAAYADGNRGVNLLVVVLRMARQPPKAKLCLWGTHRHQRRQLREETSMEH